MKTFLKTILVVLAFAKYSSAQTFTPISTNIINVEASSLDWADYDNDGKMDLAIMGQNSGGCFTKIYHNDGNFIFTDINAGLHGVNNAQSRDAIKWGDYDNDGKPDLLLCGNTCNGNSFTKVFHNNGNNSFTDINAGLPANSSNENFGGSLGWGDFNNDGYLDIALKGYTTVCNYFLKIYRNNNGSGTFTEMTNLFGTDNGSLDITDYDNDGKLDIASQGFHYCQANCGAVKIYHNDGNFAFSNPVNLLSSLDGDVKWFDFDNDGLKDIIVAGRQCNTNTISFYKNNGNNNFSVVSNTFPVSQATSFAIGDVNNDSYKDLFYQGLNVTGTFGGLWINNGATNFIQTSDVFTALLNGETKLIDMDNDGDLDLIITGDNSGTPHTIVYRNEVVSCIPPLAIINAAGSLTICMGDSVQLNANTGTGLTYQWVFNGTGIPFAINSNYFAKQQGDYSLVVYNGINCSTTSAAVSVTVNPKYSNSVNASICQGNSFTLPDGQIVNVSGTYTTTLHSISNCDSVIITNLSVNPCLQHANCTYSQGFYGSSNGSNACNGQTKLQLINGLLSSNLILGAGTRKIMFSNGDAQCIINKMPGNSTPAKLPLGNVSCSNASGNQYLTGSGKFKNVLLGQTIALGLNMRYDTTFKNVSLDGQYLNTSASTGCGSGTVVAGTQRTFYIPQSVLTYLGTHHTVQDLFNLANNALGGVYNPTGSNPSLSAINTALDAINNGFDGCRILVGFSNSSVRLIGHESENQSLISLNAYPNPFGNEITVSYQSESSTDATLIIKDVTGRTLKLYEHVTENITVGNDFKPGIYFVELIQGNNYKMIKILKTHE